MSLGNEKYLSSRVRDMNISATLAMAQKARDLQEQGIDVISLSIGEPDFDTPDHIKEAAKKALDEGFTKYTPVAGHLAFRKAIADKFKRENNLDYKPSQIVVSNGAKQSIAKLCMALLEPGDEVIIFTPYWVSYFDIVKFNSGVPIAVRANIDQDYKVSPDQLRKVLSEKSKMIIFSSPCNPTGSVYTKEEFEALAEVIKSVDGLFVVSDEIYEHINYLGGHVSFASIDGMYDRTITVNGMSKGFAMTGWRLGYIGAPQWIADATVKVQGQVTSGASSFGQMAAKHGLESDLSPTFEMREIYLKRKELVKALLNDIPGFKTNDPKGAFYFFPDISSFFGKSNGTKSINNADDFCEVILTDAHVAIVTGEAFGEPNCVRLSYAALAI